MQSLSFCRDAAAILGAYLSGSNALVVLYTVVATVDPSLTYPTDLFGLVCACLACQLATALLLRGSFSS